MRRYITENVGILEIFQIIIAIIAMCLGYYAFATDAVWNNSVENEGINICIKINHEINRNNKTILPLSECTDRLDIKNAEECDKHIKEFYLQKREQKYVVRVGDKMRNMKKFMDTNMKRRQASETSFLVTITLIVVILIAHLILTTFIHNIDLRTKWNAAMQGIILFACGFSAMLLAVAVNTIDNKYIMLSNQIHVCGMLRYCDRSYSVHHAISKESEVVVDSALHGFHACQEIIFIILIGTCVAMILLAMDLTTKYEQETEEQEVIQREATENLDSLLEDQNVVFENPQPQDTPGTQGQDPQDSLAPPYSSQQQPSSHHAGLQHLKSGSTVIAEYLAVSKPSSHTKS